MLMFIALTLPPPVLRFIRERKPKRLVKMMAGYGTPRAFVLPRNFGAIPSWLMNKMVRDPM